MLFQSFIFLFFFLPAVCILYWAVRDRIFRWVMLLIASYIFYGYWDYRFCGLLFLTSTVDYLVALIIPKAKSRKGRRGWLAISVLSNLGALGFFKYWDFFAESTNRLVSVLGLQPLAPLFHIILPVGISFYTFQAMSYTIDVYRGNVQPTRSLIKFLLFVSLFPQLVAGPIVRYSQLADQLERMPEKFNWKETALGANFIIIGLFKKLWLADMYGRIVVAGLPQYESMGFLKVWPTMFAWELQVYYDFSAYSDIAVGLGLLLGFYFPINFNSPYKAESYSDIWRRWHITFTSWLRDYLFFSLGGSKKGAVITFVNGFIVFFLAGLWHGANWTYVVYGLYCGLIFWAEGIGRRLKINIPTVALRRGLVFLTWTISGMLFRSTDLKMGWGLIHSGLGWNGVGTMMNWKDFIFVTIGLAHTQIFPNTWEWKWKFTWWEALIMAGIFIACLARMFKEQPFIYFQF